MPKGSKHKRDDENTGSSDQHVPLALTVCSLEGIAGWRTDREHQLLEKIASNGRTIHLQLIRRVFMTPLRKDALPNGSADRQADSTAYAGSHVLDSENNGDMLMFDA